MKIFKTEENVASIVSLIKNARKYVVIVSPFNDLTGWDELKDAINELSARGVEIYYYIRKNEGTKGIEGIKVQLYEVPSLHAKMYFSESEAIISSGNLNSRPDLNWTCLLNKQTEYDEMVGFFKQYIKPIAEQIADL